MLFDLLIPGSVMALFSTTNELFFLHKGIGICHADSNITNYYNHFVAKGTQFIKHHYFEKVSEKKEFTKYRKLNRKVFVLLLPFLCLAIPLKKDFILPSNEYQFISDI